MDFIRDIRASSEDDNSLVAQYKKEGDLGVLSTLFQRYMDLVYGVCLKYLHEPEKSKDAVMNIFEELITKLKTHEPENFRAWLYTLSKNHCLMQLRTPRNLKTTEFNANFMQIEESWHLNGELEKEDQFNQLKQCLEGLAHEQKLTVTLFYMEQKSYQQIAETTGIEWNKVRSYIQNGRRNLKICMEKQITSTR
jgi:RNA polymerase sigma-70 factor (ECF subfamily)